MKRYLCMYGTLGRVPTSILREPCLPRYRGGNRLCVSSDASPPIEVVADIDQKRLLNKNCDTHTHIFIPVDLAD